MTIETTSPRKTIERTTGQRPRSAVLRSFKKYMDGEYAILTDHNPHASDMEQNRLTLRELRWRQMHETFMKVCDDAKN